MRQQLDKDIDTAIYDGPAVDASAADTACGLAQWRALERFRWFEPGAGRWTLVMRALPGFEGRSGAIPARALVALLGGALSLLVGVWTGCCPRPATVPWRWPRDMTENLRSTVTSCRDTLNAIPIPFRARTGPGRIKALPAGRRGHAACAAELFEGRLLRDVSAEAAAGCSTALEAAQRTGHVCWHRFH